MSERAPARSSPATTPRTRRWTCPAARCSRAGRRRCGCIGPVPEVEERDRRAAPRLLASVGAPLQLARPPVAALPPRRRAHHRARPPRRPAARAAAAVPRGRRASATTCWCTRRAASSAATCWTIDAAARTPARHALITTPGATRFYRSAGEPAAQQAQRCAWPTARGSNGCRWRPSPTAAAWPSNRAALRARARRRDDRLGRAGAGPAGGRRAPSTAAASRSTWSCPACGWSAAASTPPTRRLLDVPAGPGPASACWPRCGSRPARPLRRRGATRCSTARARCRRCAPAEATAGVTAPHAEVVVLRAAGRTASSRRCSCCATCGAAWRARLGPGGDAAARLAHLSHGAAPSRTFFVDLQLAACAITRAMAAPSCT